MDTNVLRNILFNPNENGITIFILGILFVLSVYHFLLFFQHKDKVYLYYSLYTFIIFVDELNDVSFGFIQTLVEPYTSILSFLDYPLMWLYNTIYFVFGFTFLNLKQYSKKWYSFVFRIIIILLVVIFSTTFFAAIIDNESFLAAVDNYFVSFLLLFGVIVYYPLFKLKMPLKSYIIIGSFVLYISSLLAHYGHLFGVVPLDSDLNYTIFYTGVLIENIIFSLGLGQKQKRILQDKNNSQQKLIEQLTENEKLKNEVHKQLEENVASLSQQAQAEKHEKLKEKYNKELAELKVTSLRSQMNPHFVFNSLNAIKLYIINNEKENAVYYLNKFSKLIRRILNASQDKETSLADEIETTSLYVNIENIRFNNEIDFILMIDESLNLETIKIPSLILQPFIENALWHGLSAKKGKKKIKLIINKDINGGLIITIEDNGIGRKRSAEIKENKVHKRGSVGLKLTEERLQNFVNDNNYKYSITLKDLYNKIGLPSGTKVTLKISY
ncbi:histidine kinase [Aureibaculum sp. A20]|uniref:Histidine kinase n=1 Tax=Aureibaculum flavum TaxID=2795986 RepID=A0ABS0WPQ8_9FLAO|nr:histidine kinase [Aureibaculum flavum]MBJ2173972.1 histidine kinase [Aureibaculum flavum]